MPLIGCRGVMHVAGLRDHVDIGETHIVSAIINVDQDVDKDWPLMILDHDGNRHMVRTSLQSRDQGGSRASDCEMYACDNGRHCRICRSRCSPATWCCTRVPPRSTAGPKRFPEGMHHHLKGLVSHGAVVGDFFRKAKTVYVIVLSNVLTWRLRAYANVFTHYRPLSWVDRHHVSAGPSSLLHYSALGDHPHYQPQE